MTSRVGPSNGDIVAGVSVALVAIPQSLAYAELAGMPPQYGLYACALPSLIAAFFVSSRYLQTGAVALTALLTFGALTPLAEPASPEYIQLAALLAIMVGVCRLVLGFASLGKVAYLLSEPVLIGFTTAAAILIIASSVSDIVGVDTGGESVIERAALALFNVDDWQWPALVFGLGTALAIIFGRRVHQIFPGVLLAVIASIAVSKFTGYEGAKVGELERSFIPFTTNFWWHRAGDLAIPALAIALVGFAEPASIARTFAAEDRLKWNANREMISQGVANVVAGFSGAFPVGGSFSRSALNRLAGATSPWAGAITGAFVLLAIPFVPLLSDLPKAVLAAIVVVAVIKLLKFADILRLFRQSRAQALVATGTLLASLATAPRVERGVIIGVGLAFAAHLYREMNVTVESHHSDETLTVLPKGVLWFATVPLVERLVRDSLATCPELSVVIIDLGAVGRLDYSGAAAIGRLIEEIRGNGSEVVVQNVPPGAARAANIHLGCQS